MVDQDLGVAMRRRARWLGASLCAFRTAFCQPAATIVREGELQAVDNFVVDPSPPGSTAGWSFSGVPWWLIGIIATIAVVVLQIATNPTWREGFDFIRGVPVLVSILFISIAAWGYGAEILGINAFYLKMTVGLGPLLRWNERRTATPGY